MDGIDSWADEMDEVDACVESGKPIPVPEPTLLYGLNVAHELPRAPPFRLFLANVAPDTSPEALTAAFGQLQVEEVLFHSDVGGRPSGQAAVQFATREHLEAAFKLEPLEVCGRRLRLQLQPEPTAAEEEEHRRSPLPVTADRRPPPGLSRDDRWQPSQHADGDVRSGTYGPRPAPSLPSRAATPGNGGDRRDAYRANERGPERGDSFDRDKHGSGPYDRGPPRGHDHDGPKGYDRDGARGSDRGVPRGYDRDGPRGYDRDGSRGYDRDGPRGYDRDGSRGYDHDGPRGYSRDGPGSRYDRNGPRYGSGPDRDGPRYGTGGKYPAGPHQDVPRYGPDRDGPRYGSGPDRDGPRPGPVPDRYGSGPDRDGARHGPGPDRYGSGPDRDGARHGPGPDRYGSGPDRNGARHGPGPDRYGSGPDRDGARQGPGPDRYVSGPDRDGPRHGPGPDRYGSGPDRDGSRHGPGPDRYGVGPRYGSGTDRDGNRPPAGRSNDNPTSVMQRMPDGRPKLNLKPRSVPAEEIGKPAAAAASSIFGGARPVDTAAREREIEERLRARERERADRHRSGGEPPEPRRPRRDSQRSEAGRDGGGGAGDAGPGRRPSGDDTEAAGDDVKATDGGAGDRSAAKDEGPGPGQLRPHHSFKGRRPREQQRSGDARGSDIHREEDLASVQRRTAPSKRSRRGDSLEEDPEERAEGAGDRREEERADGGREPGSSADARRAEEREEKGGRRQLPKCSPGPSRSPDIQSKEDDGGASPPALVNGKLPIDRRGGGVISEPERRPR